MVIRTVAAVGLGLLLALVVQSLPDIKRYLELRDM